MASFDSPKTPNKTKGTTVKTPDTGATILDNEIDTESPTNEYYQRLVTANEQLLREHNRLKQDLINYLPKPGETPSTVLVVRDKYHREYTEPVYTWELVTYTTEHRDKQLAVFDANGNIIANSVYADGNLTDDLNHETGLNKKRKLGGNKKSCKRGGNKKSCKRTKKR